MSRMRRGRGERIVPTLEPRRAIDLIRQQIERLEGIRRLAHDDPEITKWEATTRSILDAAFGHQVDEKSQEAIDVIHASGRLLYVGMSEEELQQAIFASKTGEELYFDRRQRE